MPDLTQPLRDLFGARLKLDEPMSRHTHFRIGGPARWFVEAKTEEEIVRALASAKEAGVPTFVLGGGSNTLVSDQGFGGLVVQVAMRGISIDGTTVTAGAGVPSAALARSTADAGLEGLEWMITLPGTVGGAVHGNAGCFGGETKDRLSSVRLLRDGSIIDVAPSALAFGYRDSALKHSSDVVLRATFVLRAGDASLLRRRMEDQLAARKETQPLNAGSAGCVFKNCGIRDDAEASRLAGEIPEAMRSARRVSAGWLVEQADLKGKKIGRAQISPAHGNFIVNLGGATAEEVVQLVAVAKTRVRDRFGLQLREEIQYLGF